MDDPELLRYQQLVGTQLAGKWRLDALIGVGGAAAVYAATHRNGKRVAIKALHRELSADADFVERFVQEGYVANRIDHRGVVSVLDDDKSDDGLVFLVMELLHGETLGAHIHAVPDGLPPLVALAVIDEVLDVLRAAHGQGVVHRDVKPENIFIAQNASGPSVKLLDFGIAQFRQNPNRKNATAVGSRMGTPAFMPPEQARGHTDRVDARSDIFSVGATLLEMLTGRVLHDAPTANEKLLLAMTKAAAPARELLPRGTEALWAVLDQSLAFERNERFASAEAMQQALRVAARGIDARAQLHPSGTLTIPAGGLPPLAPPQTGPVDANASPWAAWGTPPASAAPSDGRIPARGPRSRPAFTPPASGASASAPLSGAYPYAMPSAPQHASLRPVQPSGTHGTVALGVFATDAAAEWAPPGSSVYAATPYASALNDAAAARSGLRKPQWALMGVGALLCAAIATGLAICANKSTTGAPVASAVAAAGIATASTGAAPTIGNQTSGNRASSDQTTNPSLATGEPPRVTPPAAVLTAIATNRSTATAAIPAAALSARPPQVAPHPAPTAAHSVTSAAAVATHAIDPLGARR